MYTSYIATILLSVCIDYISLTWLYSIPHVMKGVTTSDYYSTERVCSDASACVELHVVVCLPIFMSSKNSYNNLVVICSIALEAKCRLCKA